jgi:diguanylate cyclase (GGDEF)-like protein/PAS domain S-box-containing protein
VNRIYEEVTGLKREMVIGKTDTELFGTERGSSFRAIDQRVMNEGCVIKTEETLERDGNTHYFISIKFPTRDSAGTINGTCGMSTEITNLKKIQKDLERVSQYDELTSVFNRRHFSALASQEIARSNRYGGMVCVAMLDVDHFKRINDTHGHAAGDKVLEDFGALIKKTIRDCDIAGRMGGDEFAILFPQINLQQAIEAAERLRQLVSEHVFYFEDMPMKYTISLGLAIKESKNETLEHLLRNADLALYNAKNAGRNQVGTATSL